MKLKQIIGGIVLVALLVGGYFAWDQFGHLLGYQFSYDTFEVAIRSPQGRGAAADYQGQRITFIAQVTSHSQDLHFDDGTSAHYISAVIAREPNRPFLVNVEDIDDVPSPGSVIQIEGAVNGSIRTLGETTIGDSTGVFLNLDARSIEVVSVVHPAQSEAGVHEDVRGQYVLTLDRAVPFETRDSSPAAIVFFEYEVLEDHLLRGLDDVLVMQGDVVLERNTEGVSTTLLGDGDYARSGSSRTAGERVWSVTSFLLIDDETPLTVRAYNDGFERVLDFELPLLAINDE